MGGSINIGRLFGIRISLDWSLAFIFVLVVFSLGASVFPSWHPDWSPGLVWVVATITAVLFFACVLVHELSHALVGRRLGMEVRNITLFLFGGVANIETEPQSAGNEALMAVVGPVTSMVLGLACLLLLGFFLPAPVGMENAVAIFRDMGPIATLLAWLGPLNILIGVFNLIPAFPLDGGRLLRAAIWAVTKDLHKATRWAARIGQTFGWGLAVVGIAMAFGLRVPLFGTGLVGGLWLAFIGWFIGSAAIASYRQLLIKTLLQGVPVSRLMRREMPAAIDAAAPVSDLVFGRLMPTGETAIPVTMHGEIVGLVGQREVAAVPRSEWESTPITHILASPSDVPTLRADEDGFEALRRLGGTNRDALLVVDGDHVVGMIRRMDLMRWIELQSQDHPTPPSGLGLWRSAERRGH